MNHFSLPAKWLLIITVLISISIASCTKADINFGSQYLDDGYTQIVTVDTFAPQISTLYIDSFVTSASGRALTGNYNDPLFGKISATSYFELTCPSFVEATDYSGTLLDSISLVLNPDGTYYGDTAKNLTLNVYRLPVNIAYSNNNKALYNKDSVATSTLLGSTTINYRPHANSEISIRLSDDLGNSLLQLYKDKGADVQSTTNFINYFKGIAITAGSEGCAMGMKDSISMKLYYRLRSATQKDSSIVFTLNNREHQFNHITIDRSGSPIANISSQNKLINSTLTNNAAYIQPLTGTVGKIQFPSVYNLLKTPGYTKLAKAVLLIKPVAETFNGLYYLPDSLKLATTDVSNIEGTSLTSSTGAVQYGLLQIDDLYGINTYYNYDVTSYLTALLNETENAGNGLILSPPTNSYDERYARLVAGNALNSKSKIQLIIYYLSIK